MYITERGWTVSLDGSRGDMYDKKKIERSRIGLCRSSHSVSGENLKFRLILCAGVGGEGP